MRTTHPYLLLPAGDYDLKITAEILPTGSDMVAISGTVELQPETSYRLRICDRGWGQFPTSGRPLFTLKAASSTTSPSQLVLREWLGGGLIFKFPASISRRAW